MQLVSLFVGIVFILLGFQAYGQRYVIAGTVTNAANVPVKKAVISVENASTTTNSKGYFAIRCPILPNVLTIKHPSFAVEEYYVNYPPTGQDTLFVTIQLEDKHTDLEEVTISASKISWAYPKPFVHIIDFDLWNDGMLLLCKDHNQYLLRLVDEYSEPIVDLPIRKHPVSFFRDCMNGIHIYYADSSYQILVQNNQLSLFNGQTREEAKVSLESCVLSIKNLQIYQYAGSYKQTIDFVSIDTLSHKVTRMYYVSNRKYRRALNEFERELELQKKSSIDPLGNNSVEDQLKLHELQERQKQYLSLLSKPVYAPVFKLRDSIVIFDHVNDTAIVFDRKGHPIRSYSIIYQHHKKWDEELITNQEGTRIFARYNYQGMARLLEINPLNGEIIRDIALEKHIYPAKIQIRGNFIYYIFHHYIDNSINYVYKQRIE